MLAQQMPTCGSSRCALHTRGSLWPCCAAAMPLSVPASSALGMSTNMCHHADSIDSHQAWPLSIGPMQTAVPVRSLPAHSIVATANLLSTCIPSVPPSPQLLSKLAACVCRTPINALFQTFPGLPPALLAGALAAVRDKVLAPAAGLPPPVQASAFGDTGLMQVGC